MVPIEHEQNVDVLRQYVLGLQDQVKELNRELSRLKGEREEDKQLWLENKLKDQLSRLQKKFYGKGTEQLRPREDRPTGHNNEQLKLHGEYVQEGKEILASGIKPSGPVIFTYKMSERELSAENVLRNIRGGANAWQEVPGLYAAI